MFEFPADTQLGSEHFKSIEEKTMREYTMPPIGFIVAAIVEPYISTLPMADTGGCESLDECENLWIELGGES